MENSVEITSENNEDKSQLKYFIYRKNRLLDSHKKSVCGFCNKLILEDELMEEFDIKPIASKVLGDKDYPYYIFHNGCLDKWLYKERQIAVLNRL